ncbi:hypothetical protein KC19_VG095200 [Ceratodon purpureus]|uniref:Uncharacterized protein n=1 Tax=Ceratodon purpureus TaxID=3225 RepID=A0A8T0HNE7_CERPU|nr:hypothetical protein KC19_VG095200 [Ceratodon purpureus]
MNPMERRRSRWRVLDDGVRCSVYTAPLPTVLGRVVAVSGYGGHCHGHKLPRPPGTVCSLWVSNASQRQDEWQASARASQRRTRGDKSAVVAGLAFGSGFSSGFSCAW